MDPAAQVHVIDERMDALQAMPVHDDQSAREAFAHMTVTVSHINQLSAQAQAQALMGAAGPVDDVLAKLRDWIDRLVAALTDIVKKLQDATSFSISVGSNLSVSITFRPSPDQ